MSSTDRRRIRSISRVSTLTPPCSAATWPSSEVPAPNGTIGAPCARQALTTAAASSVSRGSTTTSGSAGGCQDSSVPCRRRTSAPVRTRPASSAAVRSSTRSPTLRRLRDDRDLRDRDLGHLGDLRHLRDLGLGGRLVAAARLVVPALAAVAGAGLFGRVRVLARL